MELEDYFKNTKHCLLEEPKIFLLALKWNLYEEAF